MARATRSSLSLHETEPLPPKVKNIQKKRKRNSTADSDDRPNTKQSRLDSDDDEDSVKIEQEQDESLKEETSPQVEESSFPHLDNVADVPIARSDALKIIEILDMYDTQELLDRPFEITEQHKTKLESGSYSLRKLLAHPQCPLSILRSVVKPLQELLKVPRKILLLPDAAQLRICTVALSVLDQASLNSVPFPLETDSCYPSTSRRTSHNPAPRRHHYALVQRLTSGDYWTSLSQDLSDQEIQTLKALSTAHAELVAVIPDPSTSKLEGIPTLGSYAPPKNAPQFSAMPVTMPQDRKASCGKLLDYGPYASFAPSHDNGAAEIGQERIKEFVWEREQGRIALEAEAKAKMRAMKTARQRQEVIAEEKQRVDVEGAFEGLLSDDQMISLKAAIEGLELESSVQELLNKNSRALGRLGELQRERLSGKNGGTTDVAEGSEEWDTAQAILESLALLASMRPRKANGDSEEAPLVPSPAVIRKLYRTLPSSATPGWKGTLPPTQGIALRDDTTLHIRPGSAVPASTLAPQRLASPAAATPSTYYSNNNPQQQFRPQPTQQYRPVQQPQPPPQGYYSHQPPQNFTPPSYNPYQTQPQPGYYPPPNGTGYPQWINGGYQQPQVNGSAPGSTSGTPVPTNYNSFFGQAAQAQPAAAAAPRAVANTVAQPSYAAGGFNTVLPPGYQTQYGATAPDYQAYAATYQPGQVPMQNGAGAPVMYAQPQQQQQNGAVYQPHAGYAPPAMTMPQNGAYQYQAT